MNRECPLCKRLVFHIERWRGIYLCRPDIDKFEKIEKILKDGQFLTSEQLSQILNEFGQDEIKVIEKSAAVHVKNKPGRKKRVVENNVVNIKAPTKRKKKV